MSTVNNGYIDLNKQITFNKFKPYYDKNSDELFLELQFSVNQYVENKE